jgi:hypothetical protein
MADKPTRDPARARRLGGCAAYILAGTLLSCAASRAYDAYMVGTHLARGETEVRQEDYDDTGSPVGVRVTPISAEDGARARARAVLFGALGLVVLAGAAWLKGLPWTDIIPQGEGA